MPSLRRILCSSLIAFSLVIVSACTATSPANPSNQANSNPPASNNANAAPKPAIRDTPTVKPPQPGTGNMQVTSTPAGAGIVLLPTGENSAGTPEAYGQTPTTISDLAPGPYTVQLALAGYKTFVKDVKVAANATIKVNATFTKQ